MITDSITETLEDTIILYKHSVVQTDWFNTEETNVQLNNFPNTLDITILDQTKRSVMFVEIGCSFDLYMDMCFNSKMLKYQPLISAIEGLGYKCRLVVLVFGSLGNVHKLALRGLQQTGLSKTAAKKTLQNIVPSGDGGATYTHKKYWTEYETIRYERLSCVCQCQGKCRK